MTSFLNKKNTLTLLIISTIIITLSITSVSAAYNDTWTNTTITNTTVDGNKNTTGPLLFGKDSFNVSGNYSKDVWTWTQANNTLGANARDEASNYIIWNSTSGTNFNVSLESPVWRFNNDPNQVIIDKHIVQIPWPTIGPFTVNPTPAISTSRWEIHFNLVRNLTQAELDAFNLTPDLRFNFNNWSSFGVDATGSTLGLGPAFANRNLSGWVKTNTTNGTVDIWATSVNATNPSGDLIYKPIATVNAVNGSFSTILNTNLLPMLGAPTLWLFDAAADNSTWTFLTVKVRADAVASPIKEIGDVILGQLATFTFKVTGPLAENTAAVSGLANVNVLITLPNGTVLNLFTDDNGDVTFNWTVTKMDFSINASTVLDNSIITYLGNNSWKYSAFYNDTTTLGDFIADKGKGVIQVWFSNDTGYIIGQPATIYWTVDNVADLTGKEFVLFFFSNGIDQRGSVRVNASQMVDPVTGILAYHYNTTFSQVHEALTIVVAYPEDIEYFRSEGRNTTFVDRNANERRTTINIIDFPALKVGANGNIQVQVLAFNGVVVRSGSVTLMWDNNPEWSWETDIINGVANLEKPTGAYTLAGLRTFTITFNGDNLGNKSSSLTNTTNITKGNIGITVAQSPSPAFVGENVAIAAHVNDIAIGGTPRYITFNFKQGNVLLHTSGPVAIDKVSGSTGIAQFSYAYKQPHTALTIEAVFAGDESYSARTGTLTNVIVNPAPIV